MDEYDEAYTKILLRLKEEENSNRMIELQKEKEEQDELIKFVDDLENMSRSMSEPCVLPLRKEESLN